LADAEQKSRTTKSAKALELFVLFVVQIFIRFAVRISA